LRPFLESQGVVASETDIEEIYQQETAIFLEPIRKKGVPIRPGVWRCCGRRRRKG